MSSFGMGLVFMPIVLIGPGLGGSASRIHRCNTDLEPPKSLAS